jgi:serine/threonine-protein kinase ULK4
MDNFLIYEEIHKRDSCIVYRGRIKRSIDFVMIYCVDKYKRHELSNLVRLMYELDHPHVMKFREWYETTNHLWLVMDLCDGIKRKINNPKIFFSISFLFLL